VTTIVYVWVTPSPAATLVMPSLLEIVRSARALTVVWVVLLVLLAVLPSAVPDELTLALLTRSVPSATAAPTVTWIVKLVVAPAASVMLRLQVTTWRAAVQSAEEPAVLNVVPVGRVSDAPTPPVWTDGPLLVTVSV